ncbi:MAG: hypothetical protein H0W18_18310 [Acidobacteria bacterium]|nr:hypothetical protein [Acidobacteriota bacterium]
MLIAFAALALARRLSRKLEALTQSYWELRYDYTRLRSQMSRLDPGEAEAEAAPPPAPREQVAFVPLSSMKKKNG